MYYRIMKKTIYILLALSALVSCQKQLISRQTSGAISVSVENSPVVEVITKAGETVPVDDFNVYISSDAATFSYVYKNMPPVLTVPVGRYVVSADNVTEEQSFTQPDSWGQVRYYGESESKEVKAGSTPTEFSLTCRMANAALSVVFGENIDKHFSDYTVTAYTVDTRKLVYDAINTVGETPAVGYFAPVTLNYEFTGTFMEEATPMTIKGTKLLKAATHLHLTFRISQQNGAVGKPEIIVDSTCEDLYETITVDPSDGGSFVAE